MIARPFRADQSGGTGLAGDRFYLDGCAEWQRCHGYRRASWMRSH